MRVNKLSGERPALSVVHTIQQYGNLDGTRSRRGKLAHTIGSVLLGLGAQTAAIGSWTSEPSFFSLQTRSHTSCSPGAGLHHWVTPTLLVSWTKLLLVTPALQPADGCCGTGHLSLHNQFPDNSMCTLLFFSFMNSSIHQGSLFGGTDLHYIHLQWYDGKPLCWSEKCIS